MERWIEESFRAIVPKKIVALLGDRGPAKPKKKVTKKAATKKKSAKKTTAKKKTARKTTRKKTARKR